MATSEDSKGFWKAFPGDCEAGYGEPKVVCEVERNENSLDVVSVLYLETSIW